MSTEHLSDIEIQQYLTEKDNCSPLQLQHMQTCTYCQQAAAVYRELFQGLHQQPAAAFDFDLETLVLDQLPVKRRKLVSLYPAIIAAVTIAAGLTWLFRANLQTLIKGLSYLSVLLVAIPIIAVLAFQCADLWKQYSRKMQQISA